MSTPLVIESYAATWVWVERGLGWVLRPELRAWVPMEHHVAQSLGGRVLRESQVSELVQMFGRPVVH